ncbi:hypothetical protein DFH09DRAFT_1365007 [Mycena vulgaris]|nr:hypothetical protein DFH09DRAFT_1365007 [Mycena vulgaris]
MPPKPTAKVPVFTIPLVALSAAESTFQRITKDKIMHIYVSEDRGSNKALASRGMLTMTNTDSDDPELTVVDVSKSNEPPSSAHFKVKTFDSKSGLITLVYDDDDKNFPFKFRLRSVRGDPTQYNMANEKDDLAHIDEDGAVQMLTPGSGDLAVLRLTEASSNVFTIPFVARADQTSFERLSVGSQIEIHVAEDRGAQKSANPRGILKVTSNTDLDVVPATTPFAPSANFKVKEFDPTTGIVKLVYDQDDKKFPFKFRLRAVGSDPTQYHMVGQRDLARLDKDGSIQLGDMGNLAVFNLVQASHSAMLYIPSLHTDFAPQAREGHRLATDLSNRRYNIRSRTTGEAILDGQDPQTNVWVYPVNNAANQQIWEIFNVANGHQILTTYGTRRYLQVAQLNQTPFTSVSPPNSLRILTVPGAPGWYFIATDMTSSPPVVLRNTTVVGSLTRMSTAVLNALDQSQMWQFLPL